jgi:hypothetical protein
MKICPKCKILHQKPRKFCSRSCANSRSRPPDVCEKLSNSLKGRKNHSKNKGVLKVERINKECPECKNIFTDTAKSTKKYCSIHCVSLNLGGYRPGSGRSKSGYFKGIYCGSTYELCWLIYQLDHNLNVSRFEQTLISNGIKYIPDFYQDGKIIEIKGYEKENTVNIKTKVAQDNGYEVVVLRKEQLQKCFDYVKNKYNTQKYYDLYDGYKPKYEYCCSYCSTSFVSDKKRKTQITYCCRSCSMKGTAKLHRETNKLKVSKTLKEKK